MKQIDIIKAELAKAQEIIRGVESEHGVEVAFGREQETKAACLVVQVVAKAPAAPTPIKRETHSQV